MSYQVLRFTSGVFLSFLLLLIFNHSNAQTCNGSLGDPIVNINFGSGTNFGPSLPAGTISSLQYQAATCPSDGYYSIVNYTSGCWPSDVVWHTATDHTGNGNGYYMLVNASNLPSDFYIQTINGLCEGTTYQFAAWMINMCSVKGIKPNITFTIEKTDGSILGTYTTGELPIVNPATWAQYGLFFTTPTGVSTVVLRMRNNAPGGVGNDLGLDDITFRPAGPAIATAVVNQVSDSVIICVDDTSTFHFTATVENCYNNTAYQWQLSVDNGANWSDIAGANTTSYTRLKTSTGNFLYRILVAPLANITVSTCRVASNPIKVVVHGLPATTAANNGPNCAGDIILLSASGGNFYQWKGPNSFTAIADKDTIGNSSIANAGKYIVTVTDSFGCIKNDSTVVIVYPKPVALFSIITPACEKNSIVFNNQSVDGGEPIVKWNWSFGDGITSNILSPSHVFNKAASYQVSMNVENDKGCKSDDVTKNIIVNPLPIANFIMPGICLADPFAQFIDSSFIADNSESQFTYGWNFGDANATPANLNMATVKNPKHVYTATGIYPVKLTVTSKDGCIMDTLKSFTVNGSQPSAGFIVDPAVNFCSNKDVTIVNASTVNFGSITRIEIWWDYPNDLTQKTTDWFPSTGKNYTHKYPEFGNPVSKNVSIRYVVYSGISCVNEVIKQVTLKASPAVVFDTLKAMCEADQSIVLTQAHEITGLTGNGTYSGLGILNSKQFNPKVAAAGGHLISYSFVAINNCVASATQFIKVFTSPLVNAGPDRSLLRGGSVIIDANASGDNLQFEWIPDIAIANSKVEKPTVSPVDNIVYKVQVLSADGCKATDEVQVTVYKDIFVPTAFSPNGDNVNDAWHIPFLDSYSAAEVKVFNRYGQIVYQSSGNAVNWDGKFNGKPLPTGSYVWLINTGTAKKAMHGTVTIVR